MANKYDSFIELTPGYESVVDISSDSRECHYNLHFVNKREMEQKIKEAICFQD